MAEVACIPLRGRDGRVRAHAVVDAADLEWLSQLGPWRLHSAGYAVRQGATILMHREILGLSPGDGIETDHRNRNKLDNRRSNIRRATHAQNAQNRESGRRGKTSRFRGVRWHARAGKWQAFSYLRQRFHHLGLFEEETKAAAAAADFRREHMPYSPEGVAA